VKTLLELLEDLTMIPALSGYEMRIANYLRQAMESYVDEISVDMAGNLSAIVKGEDPKAPKVMIFAHMDQLGLVVSKIEPEGFIRFERLGGVPEKVLPGTRVMIESEHGEVFPGVVGVKAHHVTPPDEKYVVTPYQQLYVDIGAQSHEEARALGIEIGCPIVYEPRFQELRGGNVSATSIDNRIGCAVLVQLAGLACKERPRATLQLVGTVQEEFNLRGAMVAAAALHPDLAIALDIMVAGDTPDLKDRLQLSLGCGPVLGMYSFHGRGTLNGTIAHPGIARLIRDTAADENIPLQRNAMVGLLTDASYVQLVGAGGVPAVDLGIPVRYTHTPIETCRLSDVEQLVSLVWAVVERIGPGFELTRE
jgi:putative aminopeptidase FrvX